MNKHKWLIQLTCIVLTLFIGHPYAAAIEKSKFKRQPQPVRAVPVAFGPIQAWVIGQGTARSVRREFLVFEQPGKVVFLKPDADGGDLREGSQVRGPNEDHAKGELLARVDDRDQQEQVRVAETALAETRQQENATKAELEQAHSELALARKELARQEQLAKKGSIARRELDLARSRAATSKASVTAAQARLDAAGAAVDAAQARLMLARVALERTQIHAPFDGLISYLNIRVGDYFTSSLISADSEEQLLRTVPMVVIDPSHLEITLELPYFDGVRVQPGQPAFVMTSDTGATGIPAEVFSVSPAISPGGRSIQTKIRTQVSGERLRDGQFVTCSIAVKQKEKALIAPLNAFIYRNNRPYVFVVDPTNNLVEQRAVEEGIEGLKAQEIRSGVSEGELLVTDGRHRLTHGAAVEVIEVVTWQ